MMCKMLPPTHMHTHTHTHTVQTDSGEGQCYLNIQKSETRMTASILKQKCVWILKYLEKRNCHCLIESGVCFRFMYLSTD